MKKSLLASSIILASVSQSAFSAVLSPEEALEHAGITNSRADNHEVYSLKYTVNTIQNEPSVYIFERDQSKGFIVLSADERVPALLGYSDHGSFDAADIAPEFKYWLGEYSRQIAFSRENDYAVTNSRAGSFSLTDMEPIAPLLKSKWNQGAPYNQYCYTIAADGQETKSVTGCVATSMAQVMYYFQYPTIGHGEISYKHGDSGTYSMNFGEQPFDWKEMLSTYYPDSYTTREGEAVAYLMKACGYSVKMDYGKGESGANGEAIAGALIEYFGYNTNIEIQTRKFQTYREWAEMIYNNLKNVGPVVYNGSALDGGHSFVCDGYDGKGYFHFNWGWGGMSDGYYLLDALNPDEFGIGGAAGGYNLGQQIILGISPDQIEQSSPQVMQFGTVKGTIEDDILKLELSNADDAGFQYINPDTVTVTFGIMIKNVTDNTQTVQYIESDKKNLECTQGRFFRWDEAGTTVDLSKVEMTLSNEYDFIIATLINTGTASAWSETVPMPGKSNYVTVIKSTDGYKIINQQVDSLIVSDFEVLTSPVYQNLPLKFSAMFTNNGQSPLTRNYSAVLFNSEGKECFKMENYSVNVDAGTSLTQEWTSVQWYKENEADDVTAATVFTLKLYDNWEGTYVPGIETQVTVEPEKKSETKIESQLTIIGAEKEGDIYVIEGNQFEASLSVKVLEGSLNHTIMLAIQMPLSDGDYYTVMHKHFDAVPDLSAGEEQVMNIDVRFEQAEPDKIYRIEVWGPGDGFNEKVLVKFDLSSTGIATILPDTNGHYRIYSIDGRYVKTVSDPLEIHSLPHGIYIVNGKKIAR